MAGILKKERKEMILKMINVHSRVTFNDLSEPLNVSEDTIRRDLNEMADEGLISKIRGGAMAQGNSYDTGSQAYAADAKVLIAQKAVSLISDGMLVLVGGGTTIRQLVRLLPDDLKATFVTGNPYTCIELLKKPNIETILMGGKVSGYSQTVSSGEVYQTLADMTADLCIMGTNAIDVVEGLTDSEWETVSLKKAMFRATKKVIILAISEKLDSVMKLRIADISSVAWLVTELDPGSDKLKAYQKKGLKLL